MNTDFIKFRIVNSCDELQLYLDRTYACICLNKLILTITSKCPVDILPYIIHHEYMHVILYDVVDQHTTNRYDSIIDVDNYL